MEKNETRKTKATERMYAWGILSWTSESNATKYADCLGKKQTKSDECYNPVQILPEGRRIATNRIEYFAHQLAHALFECKDIAKFEKTSAQVGITLGQDQDKS